MAPMIPIIVRAVACQAPAVPHRYIYEIYASIRQSIASLS